MPERLQPLAGPVKPRQDVVSAILNEYGELWDDEEGDNVNTAGGLPSPVERLPSPPPKSEKPLPAVMPTYGLSVDDAGTRNAKRDEADQESQETTTSAFPKPPSLPPSSRKASLGWKQSLNNHPAIATASTTANTTTTISSFTLPQTSYSPPKQLTDRPLPDLPQSLPSPLSQDHDSGPSMGNNESKVSLDGTDGSRSESKPLFQRKPTAPHFDSNPLAQAPRKATTEVTPVEDLRFAAPQSVLSSPPVSSSSGVTRSTLDTQPSTAQTTAYDASNPESRPSTPQTKPLLPPPSPVPEDSPSKYGIGGARDARDTVEDDDGSTQRTHYRGKSSTGFDIFKATTARHSNNSPTTSSTPFLETDLVPSLPKSRVGLPSNPRARKPSDQDMGYHSPSETTTIQPIHANSFTRSVQARSSSSHNSSSSGGRTSGVGSTIAISPTPTSPTILIQFPPRPPNVPLIGINHVRCYHQHARFHLSRNTAAPTPCMLCCSDRTDDRWTCTFCALRICAHCKTKLEGVPGRNIEVFAEGGRAAPSMTGFNTSFGHRG